MTMKARGTIRIRPIFAGFDGGGAWWGGGRNSCSYYHIIIILYTYYILRVLIMAETNGIFPNKEAILRAMGFSELPGQVGTLQMLYCIISNSCWYDDIMLRYMPRYHQDILLGAILDPSINLIEMIQSGPENLFFSSAFYSYDRYMRCALIEYNKLLRYMTHCSDRGLGLDNFSGELEVSLCTVEAEVEAEGEHEDESLFVALNKQKIRRILRTRDSLLYYKNQIRKTIDELKLYRGRWGEPEIILGTVDLAWGGEGEGGGVPDQLHQQICCLGNLVGAAYKRLEDYRALQKNLEDLKMYLENLQKYKLIDDLNMRAVEFCVPGLTYRGYVGSGYGPICVSGDRFYNKIPIFTPKFSVGIWGIGGVGGTGRTNISALPTELLRIISSFIGDDVLESVRRKCIMDRFFPNARDDATAMLKLWRKVDLFHYSQQVFLRYHINFERNRWRRIYISKAAKKEVLIENILSGKFKLTFYDFLRDVFILTRILNSRRRGRRTPRAG